MNKDHKVKRGVMTMTIEEVRIEEDGEPKLVIGREQFPLHDRCWDVEIVSGKHYSLLTFYWKGEVKLSIRYEQGNDSLWSAIETFLLNAYAYFRSKAPAL
jgi:hypothetical protein